MTMRRSLTRVVGTAAVSLFALSLVACSDSGNSEPEPVDTDALEAELEDNMVGAMENYAAGQTFVATEPVEFSMLYRDHPNYPIKDDWLLFTHIEDQNKVSFDITSAPLSDYEQRRSLLIGAGDAPDVITVTYPGQEAPFVASGAILPISDYVHLMPNFQQKLQDWDLEGDLDTIRQADGKYYMLPGIYEKMRYDYSIGLRTDILEDLGLEEPATWDEFRTVLEAIKRRTRSMFSPTGGKVKPCSTWQQHPSTPSPGGVLVAEPCMTKRKTSSTSPGPQMTTKPWSNTSQVLSKMG